MNKIFGEDSLEWWVDLTAVLLDVDLEAWFSHQQDVLGPLKPSILQLVRDLGIVELRHLEVDVPDIGKHADHVGNTKLFSHTSHDVPSLKARRNFSLQDAADIVERLSHLQSIGNQDSRSTPLDDILDMVKVQIFVKNYFRRLVHSIKTIVTYEEDIQFQIGALFLVLDVRQSSLQDFIDGLKLVANLLGVGAVLLRCLLQAVCIEYGKVIVVLVDLCHRPVEQLDQLLLPVLPPIVVWIIGLAVSWVLNVLSGERAVVPVENAHLPTVLGCHRPR